MIRDIKKQTQSWFHSEFSTILLLFLFSFGLRLFRLFDHDVWFDEVAFLLMIENSWGDIWRLCQFDTYPPILPYLLKLWSVFSSGENSMRLFCAFTGSFIPPLAYWLGKELWDRKLGIILGISCALSYSLIFYSQMIRTYCIWPVFTCISLLYYLRALKTNAWKHWTIVAIANLIAYYIHLFTVFHIGAQGLFLLWHYRAEFKKITKPLTVHLPVFALMSFWIEAHLYIWNQVLDNFYTRAIIFSDLLRLGVFLGSGTDFGNHFWIAGLLNLPFAIGLLLCLRKFRSHLYVRVSTLLIIIVAATAYLVSYFGRSIFIPKNFIFITPIFLALVFIGFLHLKQRTISSVCIVTIFTVQVVSLIYYFADFYRERESYYGFYPETLSNEGDYGHAITKIADSTAKNLAENEVIIHFSMPFYRHLTFFTSIYHNQRTLPEYIYSKEKLPHWRGGQYLRLEDRLTTLLDLNPLPQGIWLITLHPADILFSDGLVSGRLYPRRWMQDENLPRELDELNYKAGDIFRCGSVSAVHFRRELETN